MKKQTLVVMSFIVMSLFAASCNSNTPENKSTQAASGKAMYACPMHPEVTSDKPGTCSKCGMDLEKVEASDSTKTK
jgi:hypothetical protein